MYPLDMLEEKKWRLSIKLGRSEKHTEFEKIFLMKNGLYIYLLNREEDFSKFCVLLRKFEL
jgi:hypothetical protein